MIQNFMAKLIPNFTWIAKLSNSRAPILKGLLPAFSTLFTLLLLSLAMITGAWLWTKVVAILAVTETVVTLAASIPAWTYAFTFVGIAGLALVNFIFSRDIQTAILNAREIRKGSVFDERDPTRIRQMVKHILFELNAYYKKKYGDAHVELPLPRICTYTSTEAKVQATLGTTPENAALFISSVFTESPLTHWNQRHLASLIELKLVQAYHARGWSMTLVSIAADFLLTLESLKDSENFFYKVLGFLAGPMKYIFLVHKAVERSYIFEAGTGLIDVGRGIDFYEAIDKKVNPSLWKQASYSYLVWDSQKKKRDPYDGPLKWLIKPIADRIDSLVWTEDHHDKKAFRPLSLIYALVREGLYSFRELNSNDPRTTRLKDHFREKLGIGEIVAEFPKEDEPKWEQITVASYFKYLAIQRLIAPLATEDEQEFIRHLASKGIADYAAFRDKHVSSLTKKERDCLIFRIGEQEMKLIDQRARRRNREYYKQIPAKRRYAPIGPEGNGINPSQNPYDQQVQTHTEEIRRLRAQEKLQGEQIETLQRDGEERERLQRAQMEKLKREAEERERFQKEQVEIFQKKMEAKERLQSERIERLEQILEAQIAGPFSIGKENENRALTTRQKIYSKKYSEEATGIPQRTRSCPESIDRIVAAVSPAATAPSAEMVESSAASSLMTGSKGGFDPSSVGGKLIKKPR